MVTRPTRVSDFARTALVPLKFVGGLLGWCMRTEMSTTALLGVGPHFYERFNKHDGTGALLAALPFLCVWTGLLCVLRAVVEIVLARWKRHSQWPAKDTSMTSKSVVSMLCATYLTRGVLLFWWRSPEVEVLRQDTFHGRSETASFICLVGMAYFMYECLAMAMVQTKVEFVYIGHHLAGLAALVFASCFGWVQYAVVGCLFWESSNIARHIRQILIDIGRGKGVFFKLVELTFALSFLISRNIMGIYMNFPLWVALFRELPNVDPAMKAFYMLTALINFGLVVLCLYWGRIILTRLVSNCAQLCRRGRRLKAP